MEESYYNKLLAKFANPISKPSRSWWLLLAVMVFFLMIGLYALVQQIVYGHVVTGMRDHVVWGVFIVNFIFFLGLGYAGAILASIFHLTKLKWTKPLHRILELFAIIGSIIGPIFIFLCIGRLDKIFNLFIYGRIQSPITWDVLAIVTCLIFDFTYLYIAHIRDFAKLRDTKVFEMPAWKRKFYTVLSLGYNGRPEQVKKLNNAQNILAATIIPTAIFAYSLLGYLFGMSLRPGWHSTLFAPEFVLVALYSGVAFMIVLMWVYRKQHHLEDLITDQHFYYAGYTLLLLIFGFAYFTFSEYITEWYNVSVTHGKWINKFLDFNEFGTMSMVTILFAIFIPAVILIIPKFRSIGSITFVSLLALIGLWFKRYLIIVPTLETPYFPIQDVRPEYVNYQATWVEWALTLGGVALGVILIMLMNYFSPAVPIAEMEHADEIEVPKPFYHSIK